MKQTLAQLLELQELAQTTEAVNGDAERLNVDVRNAQLALDDKKRRRQQAHAQRLEAAKRADAVQLKIEEAEEKIGQLEVQLNTLSNIERVRASIAGHQADIAKWEDEALGALQKVDELSAEERRLDEEVREAEQDLEAVRKDVASEREKHQDRLAMLSHQSQTLRRQIEPEVLAVYDRLAGGRRSNPLAVVRGRVCQGCHSQVTPQTINALMRDSKIVYCHSCGRMLMLEEE
jgi:predicted  nucleic acid-binding Zn-ribbon protein